MQKRLEELEWQNAVLKEKLWASPASGERISDWMFLVNTRYRPTTWSDFNRKEDFCDRMMEDFATAVRNGHIVTVNKKGHEWSRQYIDEIRVRYVVELGKGKMKKDGKRGDVGGYVHIHVRLTIKHHSNLSLTWDSLNNFFRQQCLEEFGENPFIGRPRLIPQDRVDEYYGKSFNEVEWKEVQITQ